jgi:hypothetical protein
MDTLHVVLTLLNLIGSRMEDLHGVSIYGWLHDILGEALNASPPGVCPELRDYHKKLAQSISSGASQRVGDL